MSRFHRVLQIIFVANLYIFTGTAFAEQDPFPDTIAADPSGDYGNVEFTSDGAYMVWFERDLSGGRATARTMPGTQWHCAFDVGTGTFTPADCRGFRAYETTLLGRANPGRDRQGNFYAGMDESGRIVVIRPTGPDTGTREVLPVPADMTRRSIYGADTPDRERGWVFYIKNEKAAGSGLNPENTWFEIRAVDLAAPQKEITFVHQERPPRGWAPLDIAFLRNIAGTSKITFGIKGSDGYIQVAEFDMDRPDIAPYQVTFDPGNKVDPFGFTFAGREWLIAGIAGPATSQLYARGIGARNFDVVDRFGPGATTLGRPWLAQSHQPFVLGGQLFSAFQINDRASTGAGERTAAWFNTTFNAPGEIHITTIGAPQTRIWRASASTPTPRSEPEPVSDGKRAWIFYTEMPQGLLGKARLRRIEVLASQLVGANALPSIDGRSTAMTGQGHQAAPGPLRRMLRGER